MIEGWNFVTALAVMPRMTAARHAHRDGADVRNCTAMFSTARILYVIYLVMMLVLVLCCWRWMPLFDALIHAFAADGGSVRKYVRRAYNSTYTVVQAFMLIFDELYALHLIMKGR